MYTHSFNSRGLTNEHTSTYSIFGWQSFLINGCLKKLSFLPWDTLPGPLLQLPSILSSITEKHALMGLNPVVDLATEECFKIFFPIGKILGFFHSMFMVIVDLHCEVPSYQFCSTWLKLSKKWSRIHLRIHPAALISSHIIIKNQSYMLIITLPPPCFRCALLQIMSGFFSMHFSSHLFWPSCSWVVELSVVCLLL